MKKSLIALALMGAFSGAAVAQSNVTLYGILDAGWQRNDPDVGDTQSGVVAGHQSGNRFGLRGTEALGGGLNAVFTIEGGFSIDTGTNQNQNSNACGGAPVPPPGALNPCPTASPITATNPVNRLFGRQAWLGLSGGWGTAVLGRVATLSSGTGSFDMFGSIDPFLTGFGDANLGRAFSSANALRVDNAFLYKSPTFAGFTVGGHYTFNVSGAEVAGTSNNVNGWGAAGSWGMGPFYAVVTYDSFDIPGADSQSSLQAGATWDFKIAKLHGAYAKDDDMRVSISGTSPAVGVPSVSNAFKGQDADSWMLGVTVRLFGGEFLASYMERDGDAQQITAATALTPATFDERDFQTWAIGYTYPLSRRTNLYATYSDTDGEKTLNNSSTFDRKQFTLGMRHLF